MIEITFNHFDNATFRANLLHKLSLENFLRGKFEKFKCISSKVLNTHAPIKEKHVRCNQSLFMNKQLSRPIMARTCLLREKIISFCKKKLFCKK